MNVHARLAALFASGFLLLCIVGMLMPAAHAAPSHLAARGHRPALTLIVSVRP
jgi:hypothetical protein